MEKKHSISELAEGIAVEMERLNYASETIRIFRLECRKFLNFALQIDENQIFTEEIGEKYLREKFGYTSDGTENLPKAGVAAVRLIRRLGEYELYGGFTLIGQRLQIPVAEWAQDDETAVEAYLDSVQTADNSKATKETRRLHIRTFYEFLGVQGISGARELSAAVISNFVKSLAGYAPVGVKKRLATLRNYFRFIQMNGYCSQDWSHYVPKIRKPENINIPELWETEDVKKMLAGIDRGNPAGKRDYAILLLVVELGLRIGDVSNLKLDNLRWERNKIELVQHKTGKKLIHPLLGDLGWAMIDYIQYARPKVGEPFVFISQNAPYRQMASHTVGDVIQRAMKNTGIAKRPYMRSGMHSLRHALARRLLKNGKPLNEIADILGHVNYSSTAPYLKTDIDGLRDCCLSVKGVALNV